MQRLGWTIAASIGALMLSGCSFVFGSRPDASDWQSLNVDGPRPTTVCSRMGGVPYLEAAVALVGIVSGTIGLIRGPGQCGVKGCTDFGAALSASLIGSGVLWGTSAGYGFAVNDACGRYHMAWEALGGRPEPPPWRSRATNVE